MKWKIDSVVFKIDMNDIKVNKMVHRQKDVLRKVG